MKVHGSFLFKSCSWCHFFIEIYFIHLSYTSSKLIIIFPWVQGINVISSLLCIIIIDKVYIGYSFSINHFLSTFWNWTLIGRCAPATLISELSIDKIGWQGLLIFLRFIYVYLFFGKHNFLNYMYDLSNST